MARFRDRREAGSELGGRLTALAPPGGWPDALVLALPRGGVPVAYEVAARLAAPLDVLVVRKLGVPGQEELAMGALASGGLSVLNQDLIDRLKIPEGAIEAVMKQEERELRRREAAFRESAPWPRVTGRTVIVVDDGLATGATMRAAVATLRRQSPARLIVAVPVGPPEAVSELESSVDLVVCLHTPENFHGVGWWYGAFDQTADEEVRTLLARGLHPTP